VSRKKHGPLWVDPEAEEEQARLEREEQELPPPTEEEILARGVVPEEEELGALPDPIIMALLKHQFVTGQAAKAQAARVAMQAARQAADADTPYPEGPYISEDTETYDRGGEAVPVYGGVGARMWLGERSKSVLVAVTTAYERPVPVANRQDVIDERLGALTQELRRQAREATGLLWSDEWVREHSEWLWAWEADGTMLQRMRMFGSGWVPPTRVEPRDMKLADIKELARAWEAGPGKVLGDG
jgi:hypothetical protein